VHIMANAVCTQCGCEFSQTLGNENICTSCQPGVGPAKPSDAKTGQSEMTKSPKTGPSPSVIVFGVVLVGAVVACILGLLLNQAKQIEQTKAIVELMKAEQNVRYEYDIVYFSSEGNDRMGEEAMKFSTITPSVADLDRRGAAGWEIVTSYLEMETAYPNFGNDKYVAGLQPNIRPQRLVVVFRRRSPPVSSH